MTGRTERFQRRPTILIHTSVKLVTKNGHHKATVYNILIHTSVKLVTHHSVKRHKRDHYFNPHEREARDAVRAPATTRGRILIHTSVKLVTT